MMEVWDCCSGVCRGSQPVNSKGIAEQCECGDYKFGVELIHWLDSCEIFLQQHSLVSG